MSKFLIILLLLVFLFPAAYSQEFEIHYSDTIAYGQPGSYITIIGDATNLNPTGSLTLRMIRVQNNLPPGNWLSSICLGVCVNPTTDTLDWIIPPGSTVPTDVNFQTDGTTPGTATVLLKYTTLNGSQVDMQWLIASTEVNSLNDQGDLLIKEFELYNNYPNPFNNQTIFSANIDKPAKVVLQIFDILGREIFNTNKEITSAGNVTFKWNGINNIGDELSSGIYFYRVSTQSHGNINQSQIKKLTLLR